MTPENQKKYEAFIKKMQAGKIFFINTYEDAAIRSVPGAGFFVKFRGEKEFLAKQGSSVVADAILEYQEITEEEYNNF